MDNNECVDLPEKTGNNQEAPRTVLHSLVLRQARHQLNLMMSEVCQLHREDIDVLSREELTLMILSKIAVGEVSSVHISRGQAENYLDLMAGCTEKKQSYVINDDPQEPRDEDVNLNPYADSPF